MGLVCALVLSCVRAVAVRPLAACVESYVMYDHSCGESRIIECDECGEKLRCSPAPRFHSSDPLGDPFYRQFLAEYGHPAVASARASPALAPFARRAPHARWQQQSTSAVVAPMEATRSRAARK